MGDPHNFFQRCQALECFADAILTYAGCLCSGVMLHCLLTSAFVDHAAKFVVIIFNPADITGLVTQVYSGLEPGRVCTLAALDSTRLQTELSRHFNIPQDDVTDCRTFGGHGEMMAVFASTAKVSGRPLTDLIGTDELPEGSGRRSSRPSVRAESRSSSCAAAARSRARRTSRC